MAHSSRIIKKGRGIIFVNKSIQNVTPHGTFTINVEEQIHVKFLSESTTDEKIPVNCVSESTTDEKIPVNCVSESTTDEKVPVKLMPVSTMMPGYMTI